eukprot:scaffold1475_cov111-Cylindrotheca_fusiformis.AAC.5
MFLTTQLLVIFLSATTRSFAFIDSAKSSLTSQVRSSKCNFLHSESRFVHSTLATTSRSSGRLFTASGNDEDSQFDLEAARKRLESMLLEDDDEGDKKSLSGHDLLETLLSSFEEDDVKLPPSPPLSSIERDRRTAEIQMLKQLAKGDEATEQLWSLWYSERGSTAKSQLEKADALMSNQKTWKESETILKGLVDEYGIYFVEPLNRLATLYFLQTKFDKAYKVCLIVLKVKPWHFGALSGIVQVCIGKADRDRARKWAEDRLPGLVPGASFPPFPEEGPINPRREQWVEKHVSIAQKMLKKAERDTKKSFGKLDAYHQNRDDEGESMTNQSLLDDEDGSWQ